MSPLCPLHRLVQRPGTRPAPAGWQLAAGYMVEFAAVEELSVGGTRAKQKCLRSKFEWVFNEIGWTLNESFESF